jgi:hypothetical protein
MMMTVAESASEALTILPKQQAKGTAADELSCAVCRAVSEDSPGNTIGAA